MFKKLLSLFLCMAIIFSVPSAAAFALVPDTLKGEPDPAPPYAVEERDVETGYLLRDNFPVSYRAGASWDRVNMKQPSGGSTAVIQKTQTYFDAYMAKNFVPQSAGVITMEFRGIILNTLQSGSIRLGNSAAETEWGVRLNVRNNIIYAKSATLETEIGEFSSTEYTGVKLVVNIGAKTYRVFINGVDAGVDFTFISSVSDLGRVYFGIDAAATGSIQFGTLYIYKGYALYEDLISAGTGSDFDPTVNYSKLATVTAKSNAAQGNNDGLLPNILDNDLTTYWEHDSVKYANANLAHIVSNYGQMRPIDTVKITFAADYTHKIAFTKADTSNAWSPWGMFNGANTLNLTESTAEERFDLTGGHYVVKGRTVTFSLDTPMYVDQLAIRFEANGLAENFKTIKVAEYGTYCLVNPSAAAPDFPDDWDKEVAIDDTTNVTASQFYGYTSREEFNVFKFTDSSDTENVTLSKDFSLDASMKAEFKFEVEDTKCFSEDIKGISIEYLHDSGNYLSFYMQGADFYFGQFDGTGAVLAGTEPLKVIDNVKAEIWYDIVLNYNRAANNAEIVLNGYNPLGRLVNIAESFSSGAFTKFSALTGEADEGVFYLDELRIFKRPKASSVPAPEPADTGDTMLSMQACTLWREGTHEGWSPLDRDAMVHRKPILGWYDEGNTEVADWEIKFAADHGIGNMMYCWYHLPSPDGPIMKSGMESNLWEGVFNSQYRDYHTFSLMYTNNAGQPTAKSFQAFIDDYWPYFIEVFFKNPNYAKTADNKPLFFIYDPEYFITLMGDISGQSIDGIPDGVADIYDTQYAFKVMNERCVEAGFAGVYISAEYRGDSVTKVQKIENCGYDSVFGYTWHAGEYNMSQDNVLAKTQQTMMAQAGAINTDSFNVIPNISKSWDPRGWNYQGYLAPSPIYNYDLEHYRQLALWCRDVLGGAPIASNGQKMIMLDNWNEYSEGHWLFPTYGTPSYKGGEYTYGYLDVLREVFGTGEFAHTDYLPLEDGFGPYDSWYPAGWDDQNDSYLNLYGKIPEDNSVFLDTFVDSVIGYNSVEGTAGYSISGQVEGDVYLIDASDCARLVIDTTLLNAIKSTDKNLKIKMLYGTAEFNKTDLSAVSGKLDIVLRQKLEISGVYNKIKAAAANKYDIYKGYDYRLETRVNGYLTDLDLTLTLDAKGADDLGSVAGTVTKLNLTKAATFVYSGSSNVDLVLLVNYN